MLCCDSWPESFLVCSKPESFLVCLQVLDVLPVQDVCALGATCKYFLHCSTETKEASDLW